MRRSKGRFKLLAVLCAALTWYCGAGVVMNFAFSTSIDDGSHYARAGIIFEVLTVISLAATIAFIVLAWRSRQGDTLIKKGEAGRRE
jgi:hypothetical protein